MKQRTVRHKWFRIVHLIYALVGLVLLAFVPWEGWQVETQLIWFRIIQFYMIGVMVFPVVGYLLEQGKAVTVQDRIKQAGVVLWAGGGIVLAILIAAGVHHMMGYLMMYVIGSFCLSFVIFCLKQI